MRKIHEQKGYSVEWIEKRPHGIAVRDKLKDECKILRNTHCANRFGSNEPNSREQSRTEGRVIPAPQPAREPRSKSREM